MWTCTNIRACSWFFPIIDLLTRSEQKKHRQFRHLWLVKVNITLQSFLLHLFNKLPIRDIFFLLMVLLAIVSLSLSSNKLANNFNYDTNLLIAVISLLISNRKVLTCSCLATNNNFWCRQELKMWILGALFKQKRFPFENLANVVSWTKVVPSNKNPLRMSVFKSKFQNPQNLDEKNVFFHHSRKNNWNSRQNKK